MKRDTVWGICSGEDRLIFSRMLTKSIDCNCCCNSLAFEKYEDVGSIYARCCNARSYCPRPAQWFAAKILQYAWSTAHASGFAKTMRIASSTYGALNVLSCNESSCSAALTSPSLASSINFVTTTSKSPTLVASRMAKRFARCAMRGSSLCSCNTGGLGSLFISEWMTSSTNFWDPPSLANDSPRWKKGYNASLVLGAYFA